MVAMVRPFVMLLLLPVGGALAWGPRTHGAVHDLAVPALAAHPSGRFLGDPATARRFADAGLCADLTFSLLSLGKSDPAYDALFHRGEFLDHLVARSRAAGSDVFTFALGFAGHLPADRVGNAASSPTSRNVFGWPGDRDPWGKPVSDPSLSAEHQLAGVTHRLNKFLVDLLVDASRSGGPAWRDPVEVDYLVGSILEYDGPGALPAELREDPARVAGDVRRFRRGFKWSLRALSLVSGHLRRNEALMRGIAADLGDAHGATMQESAARVVDQVRHHLEAPASRGHQRGTHAHGVDLGQDREFLEGLEQAAKAVEEGRVRPGPARVDGGDLEGVRKHAYRSFFTRVLLPGARWPAVKAAVRRNVP